MQTSLCVMSMDVVQLYSSSLRFLIRGQIQAILCQPTFWCHGEPSNFYLNLTSQSQSLDSKCRVSQRYEFNFPMGVNRNMYHHFLTGTCWSALCYSNGQFIVYIRGRHLITKGPQAPQHYLNFMQQKIVNFIAFYCVSF